MYAGSLISPGLPPRPPDPTTKIRPRPSKPDISDPNNLKRHRFVLLLRHFNISPSPPSIEETALTARNPNIPASSIFFVSSSFSMTIEFAHLGIEFLHFYENVRFWKVMKGNQKVAKKKGVPNERRRLSFRPRPSPIAKTPVVAEGSKKSKKTKKSKKSTQEREPSYVSLSVTDESERDGSESEV
ncbi:unnamed protein product [Eruca vesicaria subsp. sativa]|uniref:Uncharacterized protein n=1 Tax=Eruca vesicaria subsp. sativa TaxID=29727 RepID=A0ABC8KKA8_ERUVS|nr:unnamed protein product [Eruca vesicaria subsp. sativa]